MQHGGVFLHLHELLIGGLGRDLLLNYIFPAHKLGLLVYLRLEELIGSALIYFIEVWCWILGLEDFDVLLNSYAGAHRDLCFLV